MKRFTILLLLILGFGGCAPFHAPSPVTHTDEISKKLLKSWQEGPAKARIQTFIKEVTTRGSTSFVPPGQRRAFFDMDGTLLCEKPNYVEVVLAEHKLLAKANTDPTLADKPIYKAVLNQDHDYLYQHVKEVIAEAFAGETLSSYSNECRNFLEAEKHPRFDRPYALLFYQPMLELIQYLQQHRFTVFIVSTSQQEFIRSISQDRIGIAPQQIIGTMLGFKLANLEENAPPVFIRDNTYFNPYNADNDKVVRIRERALLPGIFTFGNSMGDYAMLDAIADGGLPNLVCILDHDDAEREYEYHKETLLEKARSRHWLVVSMENDFRKVFMGE